MKKYLKKKYLKNIITKKKSGYILILTLFMIAMSITLLTSILQKTMNFQKQVSFDFDRERARLLALGAIELALSQVSFKQQSEQDSSSNNKENKPNTDQSVTAQSGDTSGSKQENKDFEKEWFKKLAPVINKWQTIELKESNLSATIRLYITCQQGKLDLNYIQKQIEQEEKNKSKELEKQAVNPETEANPIQAPGQPVTPGSERPQEIKQSEKAAESEENKQTKKTFVQAINNAIEKSLKINIIDSIKELDNIILRGLESPLDFLKLKQFSNLKQNAFVDLDQKDIIYLTDLFSVNFELNEPKPKASLIWLPKLTAGGANSDISEINPWLLSKSLCKLLELKAGQINIQDLVSKFKNNANWQKDWDEIFAPIYGKSFNSIDKEISNLFSKGFAPKAFSVVIYINLERSSQRLFAILKKDNLDKNSKDMKFKIAKIYWF